MLFCEWRRVNDRGNFKYFCYNVKLIVNSRESFMGFSLGLCCYIWVLKRGENLKRCMYKNYLFCEMFWLMREVNLIFSFVLVYVCLKGVEILGDLMLVLCWIWNWNKWW